MNIRQSSPTPGLVALLCAALAGCGTPQKYISVTSNPDGADVYLNGGMSGKTPYTNTLPFENKTTSYAVSVTKTGFKEGDTNIFFEPNAQHEYHFELEKIEEVSLELASVEVQKTAEGAKLELVRRPTLAYLEVIERSPNVAAVTRVTANEDTNSNFGPPVLSPTKDELVYADIVTEGTGANDWYSNIKKISVGGVGQTLLTYGKWRDIDPAYAPSGSNVVFSSNRTSQNETLYRINSESAGGITRITSSSAQDYGPSLGLNGSLIAYVSLPPNAKIAKYGRFPGTATWSLNCGRVNRRAFHRMAARFSLRGATRSGETGNCGS